MNLFQDETANILLDLGFESGWIRELSPLISPQMMSDILTKIRAQRSVNTIYPDEQDVFKVFKVTPFDSIKVVIIGQDPYFNGNADGLAFSCKRDSSPSLIQIRRAIHNDIPDKTGVVWDDLIYLAIQGVFLYNPALTVVKDNPASHVHIWKEFSESILPSLITKDHLVWMAWGKVAQEVLPRFMKESHLVLKATHPVSASYNNTTWQCDHFSKANEYLKTNNMEEIKWL
jgi:uracil-DNA glycosylase